MDDIEKIEEKSIDIQNEYDSIMQLRPTTVYEIELQEMKISKLKRRLEKLIEETEHHAAVEDFLKNGPGGKDKE